MTMMSLSRQTSDKMRGGSAAFATPLWEKILSLKHFFSNSPKVSPPFPFSTEEENQHLLLENQMLENEISFLQKQFDEQLLVSSQIGHIASEKPTEARLLASDFQKSLQTTLKNIRKRIQATPARVIFRSLDTWNSFLWINAGAAANRDSPSVRIAINSPVIIGKAIVGVVDYVGERQSRVRLISDTRLTPSVRALRGSEQDFLISDQIEKLVQQMKHHKSLPLTSEEHTSLEHLLARLNQNLKPMRKNWYLAKGELLGSVYSARLGQNVNLKGTGFNYDFADEEGEGRDLLSGKSLSHPQDPGIPIIKVNDILVTTGMDGIFPAGFHAAIVTRVGILKEGDYYYDLEAQPLAGPLDELTLVYVLPPLTQENLRTEIQRR